jgi:hypothetical protein
MVEGGVLFYHQPLLEMIFFPHFQEHLFQKGGISLLQSLYHGIPIEISLEKSGKALRDIPEQELPGKLQMFFQHIPVGKEENAPHQSGKQEGDKDRKVHAAAWL